MPSSGPSVTRPTPSKTTSAVNGAAKVFREFKWGLLTLFLLMVVVIGLVYDGGKKKAEAPKPTPTAGPDSTNLVDGLGHGPLSTDPSVPVFSDDPATPTPPVAQNPNPSMNPGYAQPTNGGSTTAGNTNGTTQSPLPFVPPTVPETKPVVQNPGTSVTPKAVTVPAPETSANVYVVKSGDTLSGISNQFFAGRTQSGIKAILAANKDVIPDANRLRPGMKLKIPNLPETASKTEALKTANPVAEKPKTTTAAEGTYVVQSGDTLERIARKLLNNGSRWNEIYEMNRDRISDPGRLRVGMQLKVKGLKETSTTEDAKPSSPEKHAQPSSTAETKEAKAEKHATVNVERPVWMP
ncbi:MAG: LysM peptidoglycan-binding domain-containing protein [Planctomycetota bacterium]|nr:LysM peptidoglycan-binding domain-containing protein [Planctomycetota bacterium]